MKDLLNRIHARLGDFWWYSLMLFVACRAADALNVFVGITEDAVAKPSL